MAHIWLAYSWWIHPLVSYSFGLFWCHIEWVEHEIWVHTWEINFLLIFCTDWLSFFQWGVGVYAFWFWPTGWEQKMSRICSFLHDLNLNYSGVPPMFWSLCVELIVVWKEEENDCPIFWSLYFKVMSVALYRVVVFLVLQISFLVVDLSELALFSWHCTYGFYYLLLFLYTCASLRH